MSSEPQKELIRAIAQLRRFQTHFTTVADFRELVWETRFVLTKVQGDVIRDAIKQGSADKEVLGLLIALNVAISTCNEVEALSHDPATNESLLTSILLAQSNFAIIEGLLVRKANVK